MFNLQQLPKIGTDWVISIVIFLVSFDATLLLANEVHGRNAVIATRSSFASESGIEVMRAGGNAVDGIVAATFTLAVTYPAAGNLGGGGFAVIRLADGTVISNDHREVAPSGAHRDMFLDEDGNYNSALSLSSHLASGVPGSVAGLLDIHERYGLLDRKQVLRKAISLASKGFPLSHEVAEQIASRRELWLKHPSSARIFLKSDRSVYSTGEIFRQPDLAKTLERISAEGCSGFYAGETANLIAVQMERGGGLISKDDLANYESKWRVPIRSRYRDYEIVSMGPPSSGGVLLVQMLNMVGKYNIREMGYGSADTVHLMIEVERRAFADRATHLGDPDFYPVPIGMLISKQYARFRMESIVMGRASLSEAIGPGSVEKFSESLETTHLSVIDKDGNAVALTTTLNGAYGNGIVVEGAGFLLNNEMDDFSAKSNVPNMFGLIGGEANAIEPEKRMLSSMTPTILMRDDEPLLVTGSPGGPTIITTVFQILLNVIDHDMKLSDAVSKPRFHHQWLPNRVRVEQHGLSPDTIRLLEARGHIDIQLMGREAAIGDAHSVMRNGKGLVGVSDPRHGGIAAAF